MLHITRGVVFKSIKYSETSVITTIYTEKFGIQTYMVNGVRSQRSKSKYTQLQPLTLLDLVVYHRANKNLQRIKEMNFGHIFRSIPFDIVKGSIGLFLIEVLTKSIKEEEPNQELFDYIYDNIQLLDEYEGSVSDFHLQFMLHLSRFLGFSPADNYSVGTPYFDMREGIFTGIKPSHPDVAEEPYSRFFSLLNSGGEKFLLKDRRKMLVLLLQYYDLHIPNFKQINSYRILESVLH